MKQRTALALTLAVLACAPTFGQATSTNSISLQAKLDGVAGPTANLTAKFFDAPTGGVQVGATITLSNVPVQNGIVSVPVSPVDATIFNGSTRYMEVTANGTTLSPRTLVTSVPYAVATSAVRFGDDRGLSEHFGFGSGSTTPDAGVFTFGDGTGWRLRAQRNAAFGGTTFADLTDRGEINVYGAGGSYAVHNSTGELVAYMDNVADCGRLVLKHDGIPNATIVLSGRTGEVNCKFLTITGADVAEPFNVTTSDTAPEPAPGMVVSIDPTNPGKLVVCTTPYDKRVAGAISGANGLSVGVVMGNDNTDPLIKGDHPVAMSGRVYVWCDASFGGITPGDRLTTSETPGHAMKAADEARAGGAVIGKAMTGLKEGKGLVLVLVNLQ